jgi:ATP-dependent Lon protease
MFLIGVDEPAPLPGGTIIVDIPANKLHLFSSVEINKIEYVILGIVDHVAPYELLENMDHLADGVLKRVGVMCQIEEREQAEDFSAITLKVDHRVLIRKLERNRSQDDPYTIWVEPEPVTEEFENGEEELRTDIGNLIDTLIKNQKFWQTGDRDVTERVRSTPDVLDRVSVLGEAVLRGEARMNFLQALDNCDRWNILLATIKDAVKKRRSVSHKKNKTTKTVAKKPKSKPKAKKVLTWRERVEKSAMPAKVKERVLREVTKLENCPKNNTEYAQTADYLSWIVSVPWGKTSYIPTDLRKLHSTLDETHYGLDDVKEHMLEIMCLQELQGGSNGTVLCFVGPPGVGKTTIAKAIADVSNRPLIQIALGGITDTSELRGHRRTYVASRPGRLVSELRDKGSMDPLILLDEVDKLAHYRGDPAAALLELLDPEQNDKFVDHYLEIPIDLSKAMFICTANEERNIPAPLLDRMEIIRFRKYNLEERKVITDSFLLPKLIKSYGTQEMDIQFEPEALSTVHAVPSVRSIEKILGKALRKGMARIHVYGQETYVVSKSDIVDIKKNYGDTSKKKLGFVRKD